MKTTRHGVGSSDIGSGGEGSDDTSSSWFGSNGVVNVLGVTSMENRPFFTNGATT